MATKKKTAAPKNARRTADPTPAKAVKTKAKKPASKPKKKAAPKAPPAKSVDSLLKTFEKERVTLGSSLAAGRKKIETLAKKIAAMKTELEETKRAVVETELAIETLDSRRDKEIGALLQEMGVDLGKAAAAVKVKPPVDKGTPLFDEETNSEG